MKYGKSPARRAVKLRFLDYIDTARLPEIPAIVGHQDRVTDWNMLGNDIHGDCVWAGAAHETMLWNAEAARTVTITTADVLADYSTLTGFDPSSPSTDQGTDMQAAARYRMQTGIVDASGNRHKVAAYIALTPGSVNELAAAVYLFGAAGIGLEVPAYAETQFQNGLPWDLCRGDRTIQGGHYVPVVGRNGNFLVVTWGRLHRMTPAFFQRWCDEAICYLSEEMLSGGKSLEGFDLPALRADLNAVARA